MIFCTPATFAGITFGYVSIDSIAGPSEILVLADETANPRYVAGIVPSGLVSIQLLRSCLR